MGNDKKLEKQKIKYSGDFEEYFYLPGIYVGAAALVSSLVLMPLSEYVHDIKMVENGAGFFISGLSNLILYTVARDLFGLNSNLEKKLNE